MTEWTFAARLRARERIVGYWSQLPVPAVQERVARHGYDYVCMDAQHGFLDYQAILNGLIGIDSGSAISTNGHGCAGLVRVAANNLMLIGQALDAGAQGVIVPLVDTAEDAAAAVRACRFAPRGSRSYGPMRSSLRSKGLTATMDSQVACIVMIETRKGLDNIAEIAAVPELDGLYVGPADLTLALGAESLTDQRYKEDFDAALTRVRSVCAAAGIAAGIHTNDGAVASRYLEEGFTFATISSDLNHLDQAALQHFQKSKAS